MFTSALFDRAENAFRNSCKTNKVWTLLLASAILTCGCATSPFSNDITEKAKRQPAFSAVKSTPEAYKGTTVIYGGTIIKTKNLKDYTEIEVLQKELDSDFEPKDTDVADGRFLARCPGFYDPAIFKEGRDISVAGEVAGKEERPIGEVSYTYPLISCRQAKIWYKRPNNYYASPYWYGPYDYWGYGPWPPRTIIVRPVHKH